MDEDKKAQDKGLHNFKNLFRKPNSYEWTILFMLICVFFMAWAYNHDTKQCKEFVANIDNICLEYNKNIVTNGTPIKNLSLEIDTSNIKRGKQNEE